MVILDTHALLWWAVEPKRLSQAAAHAISDADRLGVPTIVFWELSVLLRKRRIALDIPLREWVDRVCSNPRLMALPLTTGIALSADGLPMHPDPVDRFIVATAVAHHAPLVTKDRLLRALKMIESVW